MIFLFLGLTFAAQKNGEEVFNPNAVGQEYMKF